MHRRGYRFVAPVELAPRGRAELERALPVTEREAGQASREIQQQAVRPSIGGELVPWSAAIIFAALAAAAVWFAVYRERPAEPPAARFTIAAEDGTAFDTRAPALAVSPDATALAWSACDANGCRLFVRPMNRADATAVAGTEDAAAPFFSGDGRWIAFFADGRLKKVALAGGAPVTLAEAPDPLGGVWTRDEQIVFAGSRFGGLKRVSQDGGEARVLTTPNAAQGEVRHAWPVLSPSGRLLFFTIATSPHGSSGRIAVMRAGASGRASWATLLADAVYVRAIAEDAIVFSRGGELHAVGFDPRALTVVGPPHVVGSAAISADGTAHVAAAGGTLISGIAQNDPSELFWQIPGGVRESIDATRGLIDAALSPDGSRVAGVRRENGERADVWVIDLARGAATRLTHSGVNVSPVWNARSDRVFYASRMEGCFEIWSRDTDAANPPTMIAASGGRHFERGEHPPVNLFPGSISAAGVLALVNGHPNSDITRTPLDGSPGKSEWPTTPFDERAPAFSADGKLLAYQSNETGRWEVYVHRLADNRRVVVSSRGATHPVWSPDGAALYYRAGRRIVRSSIDPSGTLVIGASQPVIDAPDAELIGIGPSARLLFAPFPPPPSHATVALNWTRELLQILGPPAAALPR
jgi:serine/threonine-protein kinase